MPSSGGSDKLGHVCHTILLSHQGALASVAIFNIILQESFTYRDLPFEADFCEI